MHIDWDDRGVPTITADSDSDACYGFGHAQATAHAREVLQLYGVARGRAAARWGADFVAGDVEHAQLGLDEVVQRWCDTQEEATWQRLQAFCEGFNAACAEDVRLGSDRRDVLPVTPADVVGHSVKVFLTFARFFDEGKAWPPLPGGLLGGGSNGWAVSGERSGDGRATLLINPHIPWAGPFRLFEARTVSPGRSCHGITTLGMPWQLFGYGPTAGWTHTVNPIPQLWVYALDVEDGRYRHDGGWLALEQHEHTVEVRDGEPVRVTARASVHGPVLTAPDGVDVAVRVAGVLHEPASTALEGWWQISKASDVQELLAAQDRWPLPQFNILAADSTGSVAAAFCGATPHRPGGTFADSRRRQPGDDPALVWDRLNPPGSLPRVVDPPGGWVQNVNETPWWFCEPPLDPADFPDGIAPPPEQLRDLRSPVSRAWLDAEPTVSPERLLELKWRTRVVLADVVLDDLLAAADVPDLQEARTVLRDWDRHADPGSRGYPLFHRWANDHFSVSSLLIDPDELVPAPVPGALPTGLADPAGAVDSLRRAVAALDEQGHPLDISLGGFAELPAGDDTVPATGAPSYLGVLKCLELAPTPERWHGIGGDTWISLVRFTPDGAQAEALLVYDNATEPTAAPVGSQVPDYAADRLRSLPQLPVV